MLVKISITVNGKVVEDELPPNTLLATYLRETLDLTGTHIGCDTSQCGCCTIMMDGDAIKSCTVLAVQANGSSITTIEGLGTSEEMHPVQEAFRTYHGLQCGFCTPGMVMSIVELVSKYDDLDEKKVRSLLSGNLCRCTGYNNIVKAALAAAEVVQNSSDTPNHLENNAKQGV